MQTTQHFTFSSFQNCPLCQQQFQRTIEKIPRVLFCGHQVCSSCIKKQIISKKCMKCPQCHTTFSKDICSKFQVNFFYLDMIDYLQQSFGLLQHQKNELYYFDQKFQPQKQNLQPFNTFRFQRQCKKCKNPSCSNQTELMFCSQECQIQFDEVQTKKENQNYFPPGRNHDFFNEI